MPIPAQRLFRPAACRIFGRGGTGYPLPVLTELHAGAYDRFLQAGVPPDARQPIGLEAVLSRAFPIRSHDGRRTLCYEHYELGEPVVDLDTCRRLRRSYARPLRLCLRTEGGDPVAEMVEMGSLPVLLDGGVFLINGVERVVVGQLHRAPGVLFQMDTEGDLRLPSCRIVPARGVRVQMRITRRLTLETTVGKGVKLPGFTLVRALSAGLSRDADLLRALQSVEMFSLNGDRADAIVADDVFDPQTGDVFIEAGSRLRPAVIERLLAHGITEVPVLRGPVDAVLVETLAQEQPRSHEEALLEVYRRLRPGHPANLERARQLLAERFADPARYDLGAIGRLGLGRKLGTSRPADPGALGGEDVLAAIRYLLALRAGQGEVDDANDLAHRRVRLIDELLADELHKGLQKLRRVVQDRLSRSDSVVLRPRDLVRHEGVAAALDYFFCRSEMCQVVDQTNPLAQLAHTRRLSSSARGGVGRKRARFEARDVHLSHHGRLCPVETPEGEAIGLVCHLALYAAVDGQGFLVTPCREVKSRRLGPVVRHLRADEEAARTVAPADVPCDGSVLSAERVMARRGGDFEMVPADQVEFIGVSPAQMVGVSAGLIPFLEHDDANRALMGSNMQRQAVPLLEPEPPLVATGLEVPAGRQCAQVLRAAEGGVVTFVDSRRIRVGGREYALDKFAALNGGTCQNHKPVVQVGGEVKKGQVLADGAATRHGELALGRNVLVAFMSWEGYNFEDAIVLSDRLVQHDAFTSLHIEDFEIDLRDNKFGEETFTRDVPGVPAWALVHLDEEGIVAVGSRVRPGDVLVGKTVPQTRPEQTPHARLLLGVLGRTEERHNDSLEVPAGAVGVVIDVQRFRRADGAELGQGVRERARIRLASRRPIAEGDKMAGRHGNKGVISKILPVEDMPYMTDGTPVDILLNPLGVPSRMNVGQILETHLGWAAARLGFKAITPVFDGASEEEIRAALKEAGLPESGKAQLYDGRTGERFEQPVTVGFIYMLKLHHLVDDKVHARATGPYSLITQQPLGGKARFGGQRFGEMEVWALEAYGAAELLREMLTLKSDDVEGRARTYEALMEGRPTPEPGTPASVHVLRDELRGLGIDLRWEKEEG